jgi:hypothetical protein
MSPATESRITSRYSSLGTKSTNCDNQKPNSVTLLKLDAAITTPVVNSSHRVVIVRDIQAVYPVSVRVSHSIGLRSLGNVRSLQHSANFCPAATRGLVSNQSNAVLRAAPPLGTETTGGLASDQRRPSPAHFRGKVITLDLDHNIVLEKAPPSVLKPERAYSYWRRLAVT